MNAARQIAAVVRRPDLWRPAVAAAVRTVPDGWWRHGPLPTAEYVRYRGKAVYGMRLRDIPADDLVRYLEWCRDFPGPVR